MVQVPLVNIASGPASSSSRSSCEPVRREVSCVVSSESVELGSLWQRIDRDKLIVGLSIDNRTSRLVHLLVISHHCLWHDAVF